MLRPGIRQAENGVTDGGAIRARKIVDLTSDGFLIGGCGNVGEAVGVAGQCQGDIVAGAADG